MRLTAKQRAVLLELHKGPAAWEYRGGLARTLRSLDARGLITHVWTPPTYSWALTFTGWMAADSLD